MFSGIIEAQSQILSFEKCDQLFRVKFSRPPFFDDLKIGDSISCNGICLTVEKFDFESIQVSFGHETLRLLQINFDIEKSSPWNLERSLKFGDRVHGHLVTGHIEALGKVTKSQKFGENCLLSIEVPSELLKFIWLKGSITIQGVSLTVNEITKQEISLCLIPETLRKTNLGLLKNGDSVFVETDYLAKSYFQRRHYEI
jgi:riboflavin synthase